MELIIALEILPARFQFSFTLCNEIEQKSKRDKEAPTKYFLLSNRRFNKYTIIIEEKILGK
jgi:hypothetical protein